MSDVVADASAARAGFIELVAELLPELHRYCTRMTGSVFDGEDVVQDTLAKAWYALAAMDTPPPLRPWLFRIAHNTAMDALRRYERRHVEVVADMPETSDAMDNDADGARVEAALEVFAALPPVQRSALALKDVLGHSLEQTAATMGLTVGAVKAALVRARANVAAATATGATRAGATDLVRLRRYADLFNAHDWDALRALFGEETRLDVVSRHQRQGPRAATYFTQYADRAPREELRAEVGWVDGVPALAMFRGAAARPAYFVLLDWRDDAQLAHVRDFRYVPYIAADASFTRAP